MNKAKFYSLSNELTIQLANGDTLTKTFASKILSSANKAEKIKMIRKYVLGFLKLKNTTLVMR